jgi:hypothetical protein
MTLVALNCGGLTVQCHDVRIVCAPQRKQSVTSPDRHGEGQAMRARL